MMIAMGDNYERVVAGQGEALKDMNERERESVLSEARTQTQFLRLPCPAPHAAEIRLQLARFYQAGDLGVSVPAGASHGHA